MQKITRKRVGKNLALWRDQRGLKSSELARMIHLSPKALSNYETGQAFPQLPTAAAIAEVLRGSMDTLITGPHKEKSILEVELEYVIQQLPPQAMLGFLLLANQIVSRPYGREELTRLLGRVTDVLFP